MNADVFAVCMMCATVWIVMAASHQHRTGRGMQLPLVITRPWALYGGLAVIIIASISLIVAALAGSSGTVELIGVPLVLVEIGVGFFLVIESTFVAAGKVPAKKAVEQPEHR